MSYKCNVCNLKITDDELYDWECGQCSGLDDWKSLDKVKTLTLSQGQKEQFLESLEVFANLIDKMERLKEEEREAIRGILNGE
ncbi:hypothetical protein [Halalkalibacter krulwichiae]|uniref:Uncharacterized protein n=1 Tax=Halalkalibacter krulwichiae TaxID=199441 RepID=A0A1X9MBG0_9BACI|nr:hypothetical protein [Halalkalibacter krulwichiae]ARK30789.1 hypothetical protein BkAM31D_13615 [Halalkalibacter krulwichiae]